MRRKRVNSLLVNTGQYWLLKSYFTILQQANDPGGTFKLETVESGWDPTPQFKRCYVALSFTKHQWAVGSVRILTTDGTSTQTGIFGHTILLAVTHDGNNDLVPLAYAFCPTENRENWAWFLQLLKTDFPGIEVLVADDDEGIQSAEFQGIICSIQALFGHCLKTLADSAAQVMRNANNFKPNEETIVFKLCRARTEAMYEIYHVALSNLNPELAEWFDSRKDLFASYRCIARSKPIFRTNTNNAAEEMTHMFREE